MERNFKEEVRKKFNAEFEYYDGEALVGAKELTHDNVRKFLNEIVVEEIFKAGMEHKRMEMEARLSQPLNALILKIEKVAPAYAIDLTHLTAKLYD